MSNFLVTGGAGFIGSNLCEKLLAEGHRVRVLDNLATGKAENMKDFTGAVEFIRGDIRDTEAVGRSFKEVDYVIHLAALGSVPRSVADPVTTHEVNITGTLNILCAARDAGVKRVVCASSSSVYGDTPVLPKKEDMFPTPLSPYAVSKLSGEYYCKVFHKVYGLETVALRYFNVYGKRQDPDSQYAAVIPRFVTALIAGSSPIIYGDGGQTRDFTFVEDCNQANYKACFADGCAGGAYNIGAGKRISIKELFQNIKRGLGSALEPIYEPARKGDVRDSLADISRARQFIGYDPAYTIDSGLEKTVQWYINSNSTR